MTGFDYQPAIRQVHMIGRPVDELTILGKSGKMAIMLPILGTISCWFAQGTAATVSRDASSAGGSTRSLSSLAESINAVRSVSGTRALYRRSD